MNKRTKNILSVLAVFFAVFAGFLYLMRSGFFPDPDSFYHIGLARLIGDRGVPQSFPWLAFTPLAEHFTDQHFLYHVFLIPFVSFSDPAVGSKVATALMNAALFGLLTAFFIRFRVRLWLLFLAILAVTNPWLFRIGLVKAPGLSILLLIIGLWLLFTHRAKALAILSFLYVWTYGGFILLGIFAFLYGVVAALHQWNRRRMLLALFTRLHIFRPRLSLLWRSPYTKMVLAVAIGLLVGILVNPFFPQNLHFYWQQLVQIGIVNYQKVVNVGGEWRPYGFVELLANTVFVSIAVLIATVFVVLHRRRVSAESWTLLLLAAFFFAITLKSRRYVELYVPFVVVYAAFALRDTVPRLSFTNLWRQYTNTFFRRTMLTTLLTLYIVAASLTIVARDLRQLNIDLKNGFQSTYLRSASEWLAANTPDGAIVVHSDWDEFPLLFYFNTHNRYIVGLDPTFMYQYDKVKYQRWADLTMGNRDLDATSIITEDLNSSYVLVAKDHKPFDAVMRRQQQFRVAYEDDEATVFEYQAGSQRQPMTTEQSVGSTPNAAR